MVSNLHLGSKLTGLLSFSEFPICDTRKSSVTAGYLSYSFSVMRGEKSLNPRPPSQPLAQLQMMVAVARFPFLAKTAIKEF